MRFFSVLLIVLVLLTGLVYAQEIVFKNYNLKHISLKDPAMRQKVETEIRKVLSPNGQLILDERTNTIIIRDGESNHNEVARILARLDVGKPSEKKTITITVRIKNLAASEARKAIEAEIEKDSALKGLKISHSDETCAVILSGFPAQLQKAKAIIDELEKKFRSEVDTKVYKIKNRSAASIADIVKLHLGNSPGTGVAVDEITNSIIVRETMTNHTKVKEVVTKFDTELATLILQFRIIYASRNGENIDASIKDVAQELQKMFDFTSYKAQEGPMVKVQQGHSAEVKDSGSGMSVTVRRCDYDSQEGKVRIEGLVVSKEIEKEKEKPSVLMISTTIKVDVDHMVVIGGTSKKDASDALVVVLKVSLEK